MTKRTKSKEYLEERFEGESPNYQSGERQQRFEKELENNDLKRSYQTTSLEIWSKILKKHL